MPQYGGVCVMFSWCTHSLLSAMHHHNVTIYRYVIIKVYSQGIAKLFIGVLHVA